MTAERIEPQPQVIAEPNYLARRLDDPTLIRTDKLAHKVIYRFLVLVGWLFVVANALSIAGWWWLPKIRQLPFFFDNLPAPGASLGFLLVGISLLLLVRRQESSALNIAGRVTAVLVMLVGLTSLTHLLGLGDVLSLAIAPLSPLLAGTAPNTAVYLIVAGIGLALIDRRWWRIYPSAVLAMVLLFSGILACIGYAYGIESFYVVHEVSNYMALASAIQILLMGLALMVLREDHPYTSFLLRDSPGGDLARWLLPTAILVPLVLGWMKLGGESLGLFSVESGRVLFSLAVVLTIAIVIWLTVVALDRVDIARRVALRAVRDAERRRHEAIVRTNQMLTLTAQELIATRDAALQAARTKERMLATMSHEIRTPMSAVIGASELLEGVPLDESNRELLSTIKAAGQALLEIVNDILLFAKLESGRISLESVPFNLVDLVETTASIMIPKTAEKNVVLLTYVAPSLPSMVIGDPARLREIILNLLSNAVKFTSSGRIELLVKPRTRNNRSALMISVRDTGMGIEPEQLQELFQPFSQADESISRRFGGSGLGLYICRRLVEMMGGEIHVTSLPAVGSAFTCLIPLAVLAQVSNPPWKSPESQALDVHHMFALVLGPHNPVSHGLVRYIAGFGVATSHTRDVVNALALIQRTEATEKVVFLLPECIQPNILSALRQVCTRLVIVTINRRERERLAAQINDPQVLWLQAPFRQARLLQILGLAPLEAVASDLEQGGGLDARAFGAVSVLVVEDNPLSQRITVLQLEKLGCVAQGVNSSAEAIPLIMSAHYDLVLMDCRLPDVDGLTTTRRIRELERLSGTHVPIIAMTGNVMPGDRERCLEAGMDDYLTKPATRSAIAAVIERWYRSFRLGA